MESWRPEPPTEGEKSRSLPVNLWSRLADLVRHLMKSVTWFGWGRMVTVCVCIPLVGFGAFFLLRTPTPPIESSLSYATTTVASTQNAIAAPDVSTPVELIAVHVAGNVLRPGVYDLPSDARVVDAVRFAGGATAIADLNAINLANRLNDGQQVYVPAVGEKVPPNISSSGSTNDGATSETNSVQYPININTADVALLDELPGVGPSTAQAIVAYRDQNGPYASISGLEDVPGIGPAKFAALQGLVTV